MQWPFCNRIQHISTHNILQASKLIEFRHKQEYTCKWEREREREREMRMRKGRQTTCVTFCSLWRYTIYFYWWLKLISVNKCYFHKKNVIYDAIILSVRTRVPFSHISSHAALDHVTPALRTTVIEHVTYCKWTVVIIMQSHKIGIWKYNDIYHYKILNLNR